jgi:hypothetical protein
MHEQHGYHCRPVAHTGPTAASPCLPKANTSRTWQRAPDPPPPTLLADLQRPPPQNRQGGGPPQARPPPCPPHAGERPHPTISAPATADLGRSTQRRCRPHLRPELSLRPRHHAAAAGEQPPRPPRLESADSAYANPAADAPTRQPSTSRPTNPRPPLAAGGPPPPRRRAATVAAGEV